MGADRRAEAVVVAAQTHPALNQESCGQIVSPNQMMGLQIIPRTAVGTVSLTTDDLTPPLIGFFAPIAAIRIVSGGRNHLI